MKKMLKRLCTGFLALATVVTALPTTPVHAESNSQSKGADNLAKKEPAQYIIEREFLGKFSVEELLVRIVKSHVKKGLSRG